MSRIVFNEVFDPVDHVSSIPLYLQIVFQVERSLRSGRLDQNAMLPSENDMCAGFGVARSTLRRAMGKLEENGTIARERGRGRGTRIIGPAKVSRAPGGFSTLYDAISSASRKPSSQVLVFEEIVVDEALHALTGFETGVLVTHIVRHRRADDEPIAVIENWIRRDRIEIDKQRLEDGSLELVLREHGIRIHHAEFEFQAVSADESTSEFFEIAPHHPVIKEVRHVFDDSGQYEYANNISHPENARLRGVATP